MKKLIVGQSGGPTSVINGSLAGVYYGAKKKGFDKVYGMVNGIEGLLNDHIVDLDDYFKDKNNLELLKRTPSSFLELPISIGTPSDTGIYTLGLNIILAKPVS